MDELKHLKDIAEEYFKLNHIPFNTEIREIWCPIDFYYDKDLAELSLNFLKALISNTNKYTLLCSESGGYLFSLEVDGQWCKIPVEVKLKGEI